MLGLSPKDPATVKDKRPEILWDLNPPALMEKNISCKFFTTIFSII